MLMLEKFCKVLVYIGKFELGVSCIALTFMTLALGLEIINRWLLSESIIYVQETIMVAWVWLVFMAAGYIFKSKRSIAIDFIYNRFPQRMQKVVGIMIYLLTIFYCFYVIKETTAYFGFQRNTTTEVIGMPANIFVIPVIYAGVSILITSVYDVIVYWKKGEDQQII